MSDEDLVYPAVYEQGETNWGAFSPDMPGLGVTGATFEEVQVLMEEAVQFHIERPRAPYESTPPPTSRVGQIRIHAA